MKDLKLKKVFALLLASAMCVSMAACGGESDTSTGGDSTTSEAPAVRTDETRFEELRAAVEATNAYNGDLTVDFTQRYESVYPNWQTGEPTTYGSTTAGRASCDSTNKVYYSTYSGTDVQGTETSAYTSATKLFNQNGVSYLYENSASTPADEWSDYETYTQLLPRSVEENVSDLNYVLSWLTSVIVGNAFLADSYAELTSAYSTVYSEALANTIADGKADEEDPFNEAEGDLMIATPTVTIADGENGEVSLTIKTVMKALNVSADGSAMNADYTIVSSLSAKDGKISSIGLDSGYLMVSTAPAEDSAEPTVTTQSMSEAIEYDIAYSFDQAGYDAIAVTLPAEEEISVETEYYGKNITVMLGDVANETYISSYAETPSAADALSSIDSSLESNYTQDDWSTGEYVKIAPLTVEGLYTDKELTKALDPSAITDEEYFALETLYAKYTFDENYFAVSTDYEEDYQLSKAYRIVMTEGYSYGYQSSPTFYAVADFAEGYELEEGYTAIVNGTAVTGATLTVEGGKLYNVVYTEVITDADITLEHLIGSIF